MVCNANPFQLTRSRGAWLDVSCHMLYLLKFQLTRSRGAWPAAHRGEAVRGDFNSHAHVERDARLTRIWKINVISTHTLTWSVTLLTSMVMKSIADFNSHAHVERDPALLFFSFSSSIFQLTRSRGAWLAIPKLSVPAIRISTHTLTWSVTG